MYAFRKALVIVGSVILLLVAALVTIALVAITRKQDNQNRIAPAAQNRWKPKQPSGNENSSNSPQVDAGNSAGGSNGVGSHVDLSAADDTGKGSE
jgi:hypothetical protein